MVPAFRVSRAGNLGGVSCTHDWQLLEVQAAGRGLAMLWRCVRCGAISYEPVGGTGRGGVP